MNLVRPPRSGVAKTSEAQLLSLQHAKSDVRPIHVELRVAIDGTEPAVTWDGKSCE
jgi:hypothetical protein